MATGKDYPEYTQIMNKFGGVLRATERNYLNKNNIDVYDYVEQNKFFDEVVRPFLSKFSNEDKKKVAGNIAWDIANGFSYSNGYHYKTVRKGIMILEGLSSYISDEDWAKLAKKMRFKNKRKTEMVVSSDEQIFPQVMSEQQKAEALKELKCWAQMDPSHDNVIKYAQKLFYFSMDNCFDNDISTDSLLQMIEKNADFSELNNEQTAMFGLENHSRRINKSLVKDVVKLYSEIGEEAWCTDCINQKFMDNMSDMVATIIKKYDYSHKELMDLKFAAYSSKGSFARQWGPEIAKHCKSTRSRRNNCEIINPREL